MPSSQVEPPSSRKLNKNQLSREGSSSSSAPEIVISPTVVDQEANTQAAVVFEQPPSSKEAASSLQQDTANSQPPADQPPSGALYSIEENSSIIPSSSADTTAVSQVQDQVEIESSMINLPATVPIFALDIALPQTVCDRASAHEQELSSKEAGSTLLQDTANSQPPADTSTAQELYSVGENSSILLSLSSETVAPQLHVESSTGKRRRVTQEIAVSQLQIEQKNKIPQMLVENALSHSLVSNSGRLLISSEENSSISQQDMDTSAIAKPVTEKLIIRTLDASQLSLEETLSTLSTAEGAIDLQPREDGVSSNLASLSPEIPPQSSTRKRSRVTEEITSPQTRVEPSSSRKLSRRNSSSSSNEIANSQLQLDLDSTVELQPDCNQNSTISASELEKFQKRQLAKLNRSANMQRVNALREQRKKQLHEVEEAT